MRRADLFVGAEQEFHTAQVVEALETVERLDDAAEHVENARTGGNSVVDPERTPFERSQWEDRVVVTEEEHSRVATTAPAHMRAHRTVDENARAAEATLDLGRKDARGGRHCVDVERRRLDLNELAEVGEHLVHVEVVGGDRWHGNVGHREHATDRGTGSIRLSHRHLFDWPT